MTTAGSVCRRAQSQHKVKMHGNCVEGMLAGSSPVVAVTIRTERATPGLDKTVMSFAQVLHMCAEPLLLTETPFGVLPNNTAQGFVVLVLAGQHCCTLLGQLSVVPMKIR